MSKSRIVVLGAGFAGLELCTLLSEAFGEAADVVLIEKGEAFVFGYSKLDVMFGLATAEEVRLPYSAFVKPGVRLVRETITAIDAAARRVTTDQNTYEADYLVIALGAEYDIAATPGLADVGEFYSVAGAERLAQALPTFTRGKAVVGVCGAPFKCPPAPSECALMLHDYLKARGLREACDITLVLPFGAPVPPSPDTSRALMAAFAECGINFVPSHRVAAIDAARKVAILDDSAELPFDLFLGVPRHRAPAVTAQSGLTEDGWIPVNPRSLESRFPGVYAVGDCANTGTPKAGVFAEGAARAVASDLIARIAAQGLAKPYDGHGICYIEFGSGRIGKVEVDFFSGPSPTGTYHEPSTEHRKDKDHFGSSRRARWFGL